MSTAPRTNLAAGAAGNLMGGLRLALGRPLQREDFDGSHAQLIFAFVALWCLAALADRLAAGAASAFWTWGAMALAARLYGWLSVVLLLAWWGRKGADSGRLIVALLYAAWPIALLAGVTTQLGIALDVELRASHHQLFSAALSGWLVLVFARAYMLYSVAGRLARSAATLVYAFALVALAAYMPGTSMFYAPAPPRSAGLDIESVYYRQRDLLDAALAGLAPQRPGIVDIYFLGVAPYASQDVFLREVEAARAISETALTLGERSINLINNRNTVDHIPLANRPNLVQSIRGLAARMDVDEDILLVFMTSHGSEDGFVAAEFEQLAPNDLYARDVRQAMDEGGIRWRIVIVSACYSGSFIETLRSPDTLVITAAAADRSSFGCAHENAWTYFGQAYFADALRETHDPVAAFYKARSGIEARERREHKLASKPQIALGENIAAHLQAWSAARLQATSHPDGAAAP